MVKRCNYGNDNHKCSRHLYGNGYEREWLYSYGCGDCDDGCY